MTNAAFAARGDVLDGLNAGDDGLQPRTATGNRSQQCRAYAASLSALEISVSVAFSASLTGTPPMPRNPLSFAASATCWLICCNQPLRAAASPGALTSTIAAVCRS